MIRYWACQCPQCAKQNLVVRLPDARDEIVALSDYPFVKCNNCGLTYPTPLAELQVATYQDFQPE
jgi:uncharacterized Zn finger protein